MPHLRRLAACGLALLLLGALTPTRAHAEGLLHGLLFYVPNRVLDVLDIVRLRARVGPGVSVGARATEALGLALGAYTSVYAGLPGPRGRVTPRLPVGLETWAGAKVGPGEASAEAATGPDYGPAEIAVGFQLVLVGVDVGIEPVEAVDFVTGLIGIDLRDDDY